MRRITYEQFLEKIEKERMKELTNKMNELASKSMHHREFEVISEILLVMNEVEKKQEHYSKILNITDTNFE